MIKRLIFLAAFLVSLAGSAALAPGTYIGVRTNGAVDAPWGVVSTATSTTSGLQEAINAALRGTSTTTGPNGGATITLDAGFYTVSNPVTISNVFANPIWIEGAGEDATTIRFHFTSNDCISTVTSPGSGNYWLGLRNLRLAAEGVSTNYILNILDARNIFCENVTFTTWGYITNGGLDGSIQGLMLGGIPQAAGVVGVKIGDWGKLDSPFGLAYFHNCRFWGLAAGGGNVNDHVWFDACSFALIGGNNQSSFTTNMWPVGNSYHFPESAFAQHPGWVNASTLGDVRFRNGTSFYYANGVLLVNNANNPTLFQDCGLADLEQATWLVMQYDDASGHVEIEAQPSQLVMGAVTTIRKPGTITKVVPGNLKFKSSGLNSSGMTNFMFSSVGNSAAEQFTALPAQQASDVGFPKTMTDIGTYQGRNLLRGTNFIDAAWMGLSVDISQCVVSGGTDSGINGTYTLKGYATPNGGITGRFWTNAAFTVAQFDGDVSIGGIYANSDTALATVLYYNGTPRMIGPGCYIAADGAYAADQGAGTPPTVTFTVVTNTTRVLGPMAVDGEITGSGSSLTNVSRYANFPQAASAFSSGTHHFMGFGGLDGTTEANVSSPAGELPVTITNAIFRFSNLVAGTNAVAILVTNGSRSSYSNSVNGAGATTMTISGAFTIPASATVSWELYGNNASAYAGNVSVRATLYDKTR